MRWLGLGVFCRVGASACARTAEGNIRRGREQYAPGTGRFTGLKVQSGSGDSPLADYSVTYD